MITNNRLDKSFGLVGTSAGMFLFLVGLILSFFYFSGLILLLLGAFVGFTSTSTLIDFDNKRVKFSNNFFGVIQSGKWMPLENSMKIGIKKSNQTYRSYSMGNRVLDIPQNDFRLVLFDSNNREIMPLKKTDTLDAAKAELELMSGKLGLAKI